MAKEEKKKTKLSSTKKRIIQSEKKRVESRAFSSKVRTSIRKFKESVKKENSDVQQKLLSEIYSNMDKGVKKGIFKKNKASRIKARMTAFFHANKKSA